MTSEVMELAGQLFMRLMQIRSDVESMRYQAAMNVADEALRICDGVPPDPERVISSVEGSIAANGFVAARRSGDLHRSLAYAEREWMAAEKNGSAPIKVRALNNRGIAHHELNKLVRAEADYRAALRIIEENPGEDLGSMKSQILSQLGQVLTMRGQDDEALQHFLQAGNATGHNWRFVEFTNSNLSRSNDLAVVALNLGDYAKAETILREAISQSCDEIAYWRGILTCNLAEVMHRADREPEAIQVYQEAIKLHGGDPGSTVELAIDYVNLAGIYLESSKTEQATECYKKAWDVVRQTNPRSLVALKALWGLALMRMLQQDYTRARAAVTRGLELYEEMRPDVAVSEEEHAGFFHAYRSLLEIGMYLALQETWADELRNLINRGKARFALERMALTSEKATFEIRERNLDSINGMNGLVLNYFVGPNATFISYQYNRTFGGIRIDIGEKEVGQMVDEFREELLSSSRRAREGVAAARLSKMLFEKLDLHIPQLRYIYYIPDGSLWYVPFEALPSPLSSEVTERKTLGTLAPGSYAPSESVLAVLRQERKELTQHSWNMVAFGEPQNDATFPVLEGTGKELTDLEQLAHGRFKIIVKRHAEATRENFLALVPFATHIHIAVHAVADFKSEQPYIVFSGSGQEQFLRSGELAELKLKAKVVFLSACSTAVGKRSTGEGVMSLARAFLWSGCQCVVASLWPMPDEDAPSIVNSFYSELMAGKSPAEAMQLAREQSRMAGGRPNAWAGFQVFGDGDTWRDSYSLRNISKERFQ